MFTVFVLKECCTLNSDSLQKNLHTTAWHKKLREDKLNDDSWKHAVDINKFRGLEIYSVCSAFVADTCPPTY